MRQHSLTYAQDLANSFFAFFFYSGAFLSALFVGGNRAMADNANLDPNIMLPEVQPQHYNESGMPLPELHRPKPQTKNGYA